ncbi:class I SAM-dependent methyltransferase [bacterium]|nr:class I SAM-dependent methyltransferase [bacterium]MBU1985207.1 class I SAM-dependent methyltransferase [bacterium]
MRESLRLHAEDVRLLLTRKMDFVTVDCPACGSGDFRTRLEKGGFDFVACAHCETLLVNPRPSPEMLEEFYEKSQSIRHWSTKIYPASEEVRRQKIFVPRAEQVIELCRKHRVGTTTLVDIGAGFGTFGEELRKRSVFETVVAVEPSPELAASCRRKGLTVVESVFEKAEIENADVITCFELIEHLFSPRDVVRSCRESLAAGGMLILTTPNVKGFDILVLGGASDTVIGPNHLNLFHPQSLAMLLEECGLEVIDTLTPGLLDAELVRKKMLSGEVDAADHSFLRHLLIERWEELGEAFQDFLAGHRLSSHMWMVARKT